MPCDCHVRCRAKLWTSLNTHCVNMNVKRVKERVCERERARERLCVCVCVSERGREKELEREREREKGEREEERKGGGNSWPYAHSLGVLHWRALISVDFG